jgi:hypothetical protein
VTNIDRTKAIELAERAYLEEQEQQAKFRAWMTARRATALGHRYQAGGPRHQANGARGGVAITPAPPGEPAVPWWTCEPPWGTRAPRPALTGTSKWRNMSLDPLPFQFEHFGYRCLPQNICDWNNAMEQSCSVCRRKLAG